MSTDEIIEIEDVEDLEEEEGEEETNTSDEKVNQEELIYIIKRLKSLFREIAVKEGLVGLRISKKSYVSMSESIKYFSAAIMFEIVESLKNNNTKTIFPKHINDAFSKVMSSSDSLGVSVEKLNQLIEDLSMLNDKSSIKKAYEFINFNTETDEEVE